MKLVEFCIRHRVTTILACVLIAVFGGYFFTELPLALMPDIELPMALVYSIYNAGPEEVENLVTIPMESACASVAGMDEMQSISSQGMSVIILTFTDNTDLDIAMTDLREKLDLVKSTLPEEAAAPVAMSVNADAMPVMMISLQGSDLASLQSIADDTISPALQRIEGVASVDIQGGYNNEIAVETYDQKLAGYGISLSYIAQILAAENIAIPGGDVDSGANTLTVRTDGEFQSVADVANCLIPLSTGGTVQLKEIANVYLKPQEQETIAKVDGQACVILSVNKQSGVNTAAAAENVKKAMEQISRDNPSLTWTSLMDQSEFINLSVDSAMQNIELGVLLAAVVLLVFLFNIGATLVISIAMPLCIVSVFLMMRVLGITMNMMSLGGIAMGVGMIVDNSIVVLENIFRFRSDGYEIYDACTKGTSEVALSIVASTLTTVAVFLPLGMTSGITGMMFYDFCLTICALIGTSLLVALTIVPLLCYMLLGHRKKKKTRSKKKKMGLLEKLYRGILGFFVRFRLLSMALSVAMVWFCVECVMQAGFELIPNVDQSSIDVTLSLPTGTEVAEAQLLAERATDIILNTVPEVDSLYYTTGGGTLSAMTGDTSTSIGVNLVPIDQREDSAMEIAARMRTALSDIAGAEVSVSDGGMMDMSAMTGDAIAVTMSGNDYELLEKTAAQLTQQIAALPDATGVTSTASDQVPEVDITIRRTEAARYGLTAATIGTAVRSQLTGSTATTLKVAGEEIDVVVRGEGTAGRSLDALRNLPITTPLGSNIPLRTVADVNVVLAPNSINRQNQSRTISISGDSASDDSVGIARAVQEIIDNTDFPQGILVETDSENDAIIESFRSLLTALAVALGLVYFVLASQFESFVMPVIVMMILPVSLIGSLAPLGFLGSKISMVCLVGVVMLAGTVVNSSIVLVDYIKTRREMGEEKREAILNACPRRVRPVLMTNLTTILGLLPMAMGLGEGSELMKPMAIVMIAGMVISTVVTLLFTPVYYSLLDSITHPFQGRRKRKPSNPPSQPALDSTSIPGAEPEKEEATSGVEDH